MLLMLLTTIPNVPVRAKRRPETLSISSLSGPTNFRGKGPLQCFRCDTLETNNHSAWHCELRHASLLCAFSWHLHHRGGRIGTRCHCCSPLCTERRKACKRQTNGHVSRVWGIPGSQAADIQERQSQVQEPSTNLVPKPIADPRQTAAAVVLVAQMVGPRHLVEDLIIRMAERDWLAMLCSSQQPLLSKQCQMPLAKKGMSLPLQA